MALLHLATIEEALAWLQAQGAERLCADSRSVQAGSAFIAWPGYATDGRRFVGLRRHCLETLVSPAARRSSANHHGSAVCKTQKQQEGI